MSRGSWAGGLIAQDPFFKRDESHAAVDAWITALREGVVLVEDQTTDQRVALLLYLRAILERALMALDTDLLTRAMTATVLAHPLDDDHMWDAHAPLLPRAAELLNVTDPARLIDPEVARLNPAGAEAVRSVLHRRPDPADFGWSEVHSYGTLRFVHRPLRPMTYSVEELEERLRRKA